MDHERSECEEKLFGNDGTKRKLFIPHTVKNKNVGTVPPEIINSERSRIDYKLRFIRLMANTAISSFVLNKITFHFATVIRNL